MTGDNALAESKNGTVIRHQLGRAHIPRRHAARVNHFTRNVLSPFLNYHRPCHFPVEIVGEDGRATKRYPTPTSPRPTRSSSRSTTPRSTSSDLDAAAAVNAARAELFRIIARDRAAAA